MYPKFIKPRSDYWINLGDLSGEIYVRNMDKNGDNLRKIFRLQIRREVVSIYCQCLNSVNICHCWGKSLAFGEKMVPLKWERFPSIPG